MGGTRKIAAILVADVVGYSRLVGADEDRTLARLRALQSDMIVPTIAVHHGRVVKRTGDGAIVEFRSVIDAVRCAIEVQSGMVERNAGLPPESRIEFRVGIHLSDIVEESDGDLMGDGVNIAARLEGICAPGGVCLSEDAYRQVRDKIKDEFLDLGEQVLKNIARPVRAYQLGSGENTTKTVSTDARKALTEPALPDKPSIAVLPFQNMGGDPEQDYFADGVVEEIITALSRTRWLFVIARNSSFTYKGRAIDVKLVGHELGVRYVVEGSVRKAADRVRITGQLIDAATGAHLWADRFDGNLEDIFDLQERVTASIVGAIAPKLEQAEIDRSKRKATSSLDAYDYFLRGMAAAHQPARTAQEEAMRMFYRAIELDPEFAAAHAMAAFSFIWRITNGWTIDRAQEVAETKRLAWRAVELGRDDAVALSRSGHALAYVVGDLNGGAALIDLALQLNPNYAIAWTASGWVRAYLGETKTAIEHFKHAMRLSPADPEVNRMQAGMATAHLVAGHHEEAASCAQKALRDQPTYATALRLAAASNALAGRPQEARQALERLRQIDPTLRLSTLAERVPLRKPEHLARYVEGMRKAGLPE